MAIGERLNAFFVSLGKRRRTCDCWKLPWARWNNDDRAQCGQLPPHIKPDPQICPCRCHLIEYDYLSVARGRNDLIKQVADLTTKLYNMEETYEPGGCGGPTSCHCKEPKFYDTNCGRWLADCVCVIKRVRCTLCKGWTEK
jgi:hypothetical protein